MEAIITTLIVIGIIVAAIAVAIHVIRAKLNSATRKYLGMGLNETAEMLRDGIKQEASLPKPVSNMTAVYKPKFERDFPDTSYSELESLARNALLGFLAAITASDTEKLFQPSRNLTSQTSAHIQSNQTQGITEKFEDVKIHKISFANYRGNSSEADATFEISFQCLHGGEEPEQFACSVLLNCGRAEADDSNASYFSHNCPNCGAPVSAVGANKVCRYCGSGLTEQSTRVWTADSIIFKQ